MWNVWRRKNKNNKTIYRKNEKQRNILKKQWKIIMKETEEKEKNKQNKLQPLTVISVISFLLRAFF